MVSVLLLSTGAKFQILAIYRMYLAVLVPIPSVRENPFANVVLKIQHIIMHRTTVHEIKMDCSRDMESVAPKC